MFDCSPIWSPAFFSPVTFLVYTPAAFSSAIFCFFLALADCFAPVPGAASSSFWFASCALQEAKTLRLIVGLLILLWFFWCFFRVFGLTGVTFPCGFRKQASIHLWVLLSMVSEKLLLKEMVWLTLVERCLWLLFIRQSSYSWAASVLAGCSQPFPIDASSENKIIINYINFITDGRFKLLCRRSFKKRPLLIGSIRCPLTLFEQERLMCFHLLLELASSLLDGQILGQLESHLRFLDYLR